MHVYIVVLKCFWQWHLSKKY